MTPLKPSTLFRSALCAITLAVVAVFSSGCEVDAAYPDGYYEDEYPPDAYVSTAEPVYYEGHATYWYGNRWYYREGPRWRYYHSEPVVLHEHRAYGYGYGRPGPRGGHYAPRRRVYEHAAPRHYAHPSRTTVRHGRR